MVFSPSHHSIDTSFSLPVTRSETVEGTLVIVVKETRCGAYNVCGTSEGDNQAVADP